MAEVLLARPPGLAARLLALPAGRPPSFKTLGVAIGLGVRHLLTCKMQRGRWPEGVAGDFLLEKSGLRFTARAKQRINLMLMAGKTHCALRSTRGGVLHT